MHSFVNFYNKILLCTGISKAFLTRNELVYVSAIVGPIQKKNPLIISQNIEHGYCKQLHLWVEGIQNFTKKFDLQLEPCEKLVHFSKNVE